MAPTARPTRPLHRTRRSRAIALPLPVCFVLILSLLLPHIASTSATAQSDDSDRTWRQTIDREPALAPLRDWLINHPAVKSDNASRATQPNTEIAFALAVRGRLNVGHVPADADAAARNDAAGDFDRAHARLAAAFADGHAPLSDRALTAAAMTAITARRHWSAQQRQQAAAWLARVASLPSRDHTDARAAMNAASRRLAALAAELLTEQAVSPSGDDREAPAPPAVNAVQIVHDYLASAVGNRGWPTADRGFDEAFAVIAPYCIASRSHLGGDPGVNTGVSALAKVGVISDGLAWGAGAAQTADAVARRRDAVLPFAIALASANDLPALAAHLRAQPIRATDPYQVAAALLYLPGILADHPPAPPTQARSFRQVHADEDAGGFVFRSGWPSDATPAPFVTIVQQGRGAPAQSPQVGHIVIAGLGRTWAVDAPNPPDHFGFPARSQLNIHSVQDDPVTDARAAAPASPGFVHDILMNPDGSGTVSLLFGGFRQMTEPDPAVGRSGDQQDEVDTDPDSGGDSDSATNGPADEVQAASEASAPAQAAREPRQHLVAFTDDELESDARGWRTVGVDYSAHSGAEAAYVFVDTIHDVGPRPQAWVLHVGDLPAEAVHIDGPRFHVRPPGSSATMTGTFLLPDTVFITYQPPTRRGNGPAHTGRIVAWMAPPQRSASDLLRARLDDRGSAARPPEDDLLEDFSLELPEEIEARKKAAARRKKFADWTTEKVFLATTTVKMGAPDRKPRVRATCVAVLTIQTGDPPDVVALSPDDPAMLRIGPQRVRFEPYRLIFEREASR